MVFPGAAPGPTPFRSPSEAPPPRAPADSALPEAARPPSTASPEAPPPADWIPPALVGRARHCTRCNSLISSVAVACPVCGAALRPAGADGGADAPAR